MATGSNQRIGGVATFTIDGQPYALRGNMKVTPSTVKREGIAGQDFVHGYVETPIVPSIEGDFSTVPGLSVAALENIVDSTITAQLANGKTYVLTDAWTESAFEIDTAEGKFAAKFEGLTCEEI